MRVTGVVREALVAAERPDALRDRLAAPGTHVVTLTVTEAGYERRRGAGRRCSCAGWRRAARPGSTARWRSCPATTSPRTARCCAGSSRAPRATRSRTGSPPTPTSPRTMVDRIVPAATDGRPGQRERLIGARDEAHRGRRAVQPVGDRGRLPRPTGRRGSRRARCSCPTPRPYEAMKLRLLNGGALRARVPRPACAVTRRSPTRSPTRSCARSWSGCWSEVAPTVGEVPGIDLADYRADAARRAGATRASRHRLEQIAGGASEQAPARLLAARARAAGRRAGAGRDLPRRRGVAAPARAAASGASRRRSPRRWPARSPAAAAERALGVSASSARTCASRRCSAGWWPRVSPR